MIIASPFCFLFGLPKKMRNMIFPNCIGYQQTQMICLKLFCLISMEKQISEEYSTINTKLDKYVVDKKCKMWMISSCLLLYLSGFWQSKTYLILKSTMKEDYHKRDDFTFPIVNFSFISRNITTVPSHRVYISQLKYLFFQGSHEEQ
jgi:hypothetical protein